MWGFVVLASCEYESLVQHPTIDLNVLLFEYLYMWECLHFFRQNQSLNLDKLIANYVKPTVTMRKFPDCSLNFYKSFINNHIHRGDSQFCCHFYSFLQFFWLFLFAYYYFLYTITVIIIRLFSCVFVCLKHDIKLKLRYMINHL